jgi:hypothetical protein
MIGILIKSLLDRVPGSGYRTYVVLFLLLLFGIVEIFVIGDFEGGVQTILLALSAMFGKVKIDGIEEKLVDKAENDLESIMKKKPE